MNKALSNLGLANRAGKLVCGSDAVMDNLAKGKIKFIFVANDASDSTIDKIDKKAFYYNVPVNKSFSSIDLNDAIGKENVKMIGITDDGFVKLISKYLD